jgi:hypothetical protein
MGCDQAFGLELLLQRVFIQHSMPFPTAFHCEKCEQNQNHISGAKRSWKLENKQSGQWRYADTGLVSKAQ